MKSLFSNPGMLIVCYVGLVPLAGFGAEPFKGDANNGKIIAEKCTRCHGERGIQQDDPELPDIAGQLASYTYKQVRDFASGARDNARVRRALRDVSEQEMADVAVYLASLPGPVAKGAPLPAPAVVATGDAARGIPACAGCHGEQGEGNAAAIVPAMAGQKRDYLVKTMEDFRSGARSNDPGGVVRAFLQKLTKDEVAQIADYYASLPAAKP